MLKPNGRELIQALKKIPFFNNLAPSEVQQFLALCNGKSHPADSILCYDNAVSEEMFILITGKLRISTKDGVGVACITPITTVGEMGLITHNKRSATVVVEEKAYIFTIKKSPFELLLHNNTNLQARIYRNIIEILSKKIIDDNVRLHANLVQ